MTHDLRDPLHDLLDEVPSYVAPDWAGAWAAGARRRRRRRVTAVAAVLAVVALVSAGFGVLPRVVVPRPADEPGGVGSYPTRIDQPWWPWVGDLPDAPVGAQAGLVRRGEHWYVVSPTGHLRGLSASVSLDNPPSISPDGLHVAWLDTRPGFGLTVRDLGASGVTRHGVGGVADGGNEPWRLVPRLPAGWWSPDSGSLFVPVRSSAQNPFTGVSGLVLTEAEDTVVRLPRAHRHATALGWVGPGALGWMDRHTVLVTAPHGTLLRSVDLRGLDGDALTFEATAGISPSGLQLALTDGPGEPVRIFSLQDGDLGGQRLVTMTPVTGEVARCPFSWGDGSLHVPVSGTAHDVLLASVNGGATIQADPGAQLECSVWAGHALDGDPHRGLGGLLFRDRTGWLAWHWRELTLGLGGGAATAGVVLLLLRRRVSG